MHRRHPSSKPTEVARGDGLTSPPRKSRKRKRKRKRKNDLPFYQLFISVGVTLLLITSVLLLAYRKIWPGRSRINYDDDDDAYFIQEVRPDQKPGPIPIFNLSEASQWDAFGILNHIKSPQNTSFWDHAKEIRQTFAKKYGGENAARMILDKGMTTFFKAGETFPQDVVATACRFQQAEQERRPFRLSFAGYSTTVGSGNLFQQSFPFHMQRILNSLVKLAGVTEGLEVRNAAIEEIPSFPYGWCFQNFLGPNPDVISWDYSMNEAGGGPEGLEAYIRHILSSFSNVPKLIVKDIHMAVLRRNVLHEYSDSFLLDPVAIHMDPATNFFVQRPEEYRPDGFKEWRKFGGPHGSPGQVGNHPALKEHEMIGWMLALHFLTALEYKMSQGPTMQCPKSPRAESLLLTRPISGRLTNTNKTSYDPILFGHETSDGKWTMNPVQCRTTFQPILTGDLSELVVNGTIAEDMDTLLPKSQQFYNQGWTLDFSEGEKAVKRKLNLYKNNLGFIDSKEAYFGIYESPKMTLFLPYVAESNDLPKIGDTAQDWITSIVICQVSEKRSERACNFGSDVTFLIDGTNITNSPKYMMKDPGTLYLGKPVCTHVPVPVGATLTSHNLLASDSSRLENDQVGLLLQIFVNNPHIVHVSQACSISHVIWEEKKR